MGSCGITAEPRGSVLLSRLLHPPAASSCCLGCFPPPPPRFTGVLGGGSGQSHPPAIPSDGGGGGAAAQSPAQTCPGAALGPSGAGSSRRAGAECPESLPPAFCRLSILLHIHQPHLHGLCIKRRAARCLSGRRDEVCISINSAGILTSRDRAFVLCHCQQIPAGVGSGFQCTISTQPFPSRAFPSSLPTPNGPDPVGNPAPCLDA